MFFRNETIIIIIIIIVIILIIIIIIIIILWNINIYSVRKSMGIMFNIDN